MDLITTETFDKTMLFVIFWVMNEYLKSEDFDEKFNLNCKFCQSVKQWWVMNGFVCHFSPCCIMAFPELPLKHDMGFMGVSLYYNLINNLQVYEF